MTWGGRQVPGPRGRHSAGYQGCSRGTAHPCPPPLPLPAASLQTCHGSHRRAPEHQHSPGGHSPGWGDEMSPQVTLPSAPVLLGRYSPAQTAPLPVGRVGYFMAWGAPGLITASPAATWIITVHSSAQENCHKSCPSQTGAL